MGSYFDPDPNASHWRRLQKLQEVRDLSPTAKRIDLAKLQPQALRVVEEAVLKEARVASHTSGRLFKTEERDRSGRMVETFEGDPKAWLKPFMAKNLSLRFNSPSDLRNREETVRLGPGERVQIVKA